MKLLVNPRHFALGGTHLLFSSVVGPVFRRKVWTAYDKQKNVPYKTFINLFILNSDYLNASPSTAEAARERILHCKVLLGQKLKLFFLVSDVYSV